MMITDPAMAAKMSRALAIGGNLYGLIDIERALTAGEMQGHMMGNSWAITQVQLWPRKKIVNIVIVVGDQEDLEALEQKIATWAKSIGAERVTATGRDGWFGIRTPGWDKVGTLYSKDL